MRSEKMAAGGDTRRLLAGRVAAILLATSALLACGPKTGLGPAWKPAAPPGEQTALVYLFREDARSSPSNVHVELDGRDLGEMGDQEYAPLRVSPGLHELRVRLSTGLMLSTSWNRIQLAARGGETVFVRVFVDLDSTSVDPTLDADFGAPGRGSRNVTAKVFLSRPPNLEAQARVERCTLAQAIRGARDAYGGRQRP